MATGDEAWQVAEQRFPPDRRGQVVHQLAMKTSDSRWHKDLSERPEAEPDSPYWLRPFHSYQTFCPYLVGARARVAGAVRAMRGGLPPSLRYGAARVSREALPRRSKPCPNAG